MAAASGRDDSALSKQLYTEAYRFDFFQAVRVLQRLAAATARPEADRARFPVGRDDPPQQEAVRFRSLPSHGFPAAAISEIRPSQASAGPPEMVTAFFGLTGPSGVLPRHYTTLLIERIRAKDFTLRDFLDLFHHRLTALFYRAWTKYRIPFAYEQSQWAGDKEPEDLFTSCLYCLLGLGTGGLHGRHTFDDEAFLFYAGHFAHYPRSAVALERMLVDYFALPVAISQFQGQWLYLSADDQSALPIAGRPFGLNNQLGRSVVIGERVWDVEGKFRARVGPLDYAGFRRLMPSGDTLGPLSQMMRTYAGPQFACDVQVVLLAAEVPRCRLGGDASDPARLGWNTWILSRTSDRDVSDAVFTWEET